MIGTTIFWLLPPRLLASLPPAQNHPLNSESLTHHNTSAMALPTHLACVALFRCSRYMVPMQATAIPMSTNFTLPPALATVVEGGLLEPNPLASPTAGFEVFYTAPCTPACNGTAVYVMSTLDFHVYSAPLRVAVLPWITKGKCSAKPCSCLAKTMARSESGRRYSLLTIGPDAGIRPLVCEGPLVHDCFTPAGAPVDPPPAFYDHDDQNVFAVGEKFVNFQITFQNQDKPLKYCDNVGLAHCPDGYRRVITTRTSTDGLNWTNDAACPHERWYPGGDYTPFDPQ